MTESPLSPTASPAAEVSEVGLSVVADLHSSASAVLNENSTSSTADIFGPVDQQCPLTPQIHFKLSELGGSNNDSDDEVTLPTFTGQETGDGAPATSSPPPNCAICLGRCKSKCFTDSCMHQFCFKCLCEWSKVKPECPLCKQAFKSIIHNVKSIDQFEEYYVTSSTREYSRRERIMDRRHIERNLRLSYQLNVNNSHRRWAAFQVALNNPPRSRLLRAPLTTFQLSTSSAATSTSGIGSADVDLGARGYAMEFGHNTELWNISRQGYLTDVGSSNTLSQLWRNYVYDRKLYALPLCDIYGRFRDSTAQIYRANPTQLHRLLPWINRDIICLLRDTEHDVDFVLERINAWLTMVNIISPVFRRRLQPILGTKTAHFIHELNNFARSPYDMIGYDSAVQYSPQSVEEIVIGFSSSSSGNGLSSDENVGNVRDGSGDGDGTHPSDHNLEDDAMLNMSPIIHFLSMPPTEGEDASVAVPPTAMTTTETGRMFESAINLMTYNCTNDIIIDLTDSDVDESENTIADAGVLQIPAPSPVIDSIVSTSLPPPTVTEYIELSSDSSSDECVFVLALKPPHLRTPELVSLNSESDSDVMIIEDNLNPLAQECGRKRIELVQTMQKNLQPKEEIKVEKRKLFKKEEYNLGATTSAGLPSSGGQRRKKSIDVETKIIKILERRRKRSLRSNKERRSTESSNHSVTTDEDQEVHSTRPRKKRVERRRVTRRMTLRSAISTSEKVTTNRKRKRSEVKKQYIKKKKLRIVDSEGSEDISVINARNVLEEMDSTSREECSRSIEDSTEESIQELTPSGAAHENAHELNETSVSDAATTSNRSSPSCSSNYNPTSDTSGHFSISLQNDSNI